MTKDVISPSTALLLVEGRSFCVSTMNFLPFLFLSRDKIDYISTGVTWINDYGNRKLVTLISTDQINVQRNLRVSTILRTLRQQHYGQKIYIFLTTTLSYGNTDYIHTCAAITASDFFRRHQRLNPARDKINLLPLQV